MKISFLKKTSLIAAFLVCSVLILAQDEAYYAGKISPYTAHFISSFNKVVTDSISQAGLQQRYGIKELEQEQYINAFIELNGQAALSGLAEHGVKVNTVSSDIITALIPVEQIETVSLLPEVKRVEIGVPVRKSMDKARVAAYVDKVQAGEELSMPYKGKDVIVGIVDNGFEYGHINFYNEAGSELRVRRVWNQNEDRGGSTTTSYGTEYTTETAILRNAYDNQTETHGTHVAGIAAGAYNNGYYGIAPESDIVLVSYKTDGTTVNIADGISYVYDYATSVNKPCVVNVSIGSQVGPHDGTSVFDRLTDNMQGEGRLLVGANGNAAIDNVHISKVFSTSDNELKTFFSFFDSSEIYGIADIWGEKGKTYSVQIVVYNERDKEIYSTDALTVPSSKPVSREYPLRVQSAGVDGKVSLYAEKNSVNERPNATVVVELNRAPSAGNYLGVKITATDGVVHAWADDIYSYFTGKGITGWVSGNGDYSVAEIGGTGKRIISVGAYTTKEEFQNIEGKELSFGETLNEIARFSSLGPTLDERMKPDVSAPGSAIISSYSKAIVSSGGTYSSLLESRYAVSGVNYYYGAMQGTSMAAPYVTGVLATWLEAKKDLTPEEVRHVLKNTSIVDDYTGNIAMQGNNTWGYGKINAWEGLKKCISLAEQQEIGKNNGNISFFVNTIATNELILRFYTINVPTVKLTLYNFNGQRVAERTVHVEDITDDISIDVSGIPRGVYVLSAEGTNLKFSPKKIILR